MSLHVTLDDGPLAGASFTVPSCPKIVRCVRSVAGDVDVLNLPEDEPRPDETIYWYRWDGNPAGHICQRGSGGSCCSTIRLKHAPGVWDIEDARRERQLEMSL